MRRCFPESTVYFLNPDPLGMQKFGLFGLLTDLASLKVKKGIGGTISPFPGVHIVTKNSVLVPIGD